MLLLQKQTSFQPAGTDNPCESSTSVVSSSMLFSLERLGQLLVASQAQAT